MMTDREVWLKAMAIVETYGAREAGPAIRAIVISLDEEPEWSEWLRVAGAVDEISETTAQLQILPLWTLKTCGPSISRKVIFTRLTPRR